MCIWGTRTHGVTKGKWKGALKGHQSSSRNNICSFVRHRTYSGKIISTGSPMFTCLTNRVQHPLVKKLAGHYWQVTTGTWFSSPMRIGCKFLLLGMYGHHPLTGFVPLHFLSFAAPLWHISSCVKSKNRKYLGNSLYIYFCICQYTDLFIYFIDCIGHGQKCLRD